MFYENAEGSALTRKAANFGWPIKAPKARDKTGREAK
jgi:hypothetical protein